MESSLAAITFASSKQPAAINGSSTPINMFHSIAQKNTTARLKALVATSKTALYLAAYFPARKLARFITRLC
ncbi:hypothetical protein [Larkinella knui]|uniref:Uncharacterized protein n=1 Tax=Larkinella knui TaxID=2025310 RepID=A0A3P1CDC1_9BACT|nr:hypothetical protein [Larkinella knui]RRB11302.1 hypothetical protein EHT87_22695 [Larkinella knui]